MQENVVEVTIRAIIPTANGCALFLGCSEKTYVIYIDQGIGQQIAMIHSKIPKERPMTYDLILSILGGFGAKLERIIINHTDNGTFFARIILKMENELGTKLVEIDARPSDSIAIALQSDVPIYTAQSVLDAVVDMSEVLERIQHSDK